HALLSRVYLLMEDYEKALTEANECLSLQDQLLDFNSLDLTKQYTFEEMRFGEGNPEVMFCSQLFTVSAFSWTRINMDQQLLSLYSDGDLRRDAYFKTEQNGRVWFKGSLGGASQYFTGLAIDE